MNAKKHSLLTSTEVKIYDALKKKLQPFYEVQSILKETNPNMKYSILVVKSEPKAAEYIKEVIEHNDLLIKIPYTRNYFLIIMQDKSIKESILYGSQLASIINTKYMIKDKSRSDVKMSLIYVEHNTSLSHLVYEIIQTYKNLKNLSSIIHNLWVEIKKI
ncbi:MAG: hypothetical protein ABGX23_00625 [Nautiliaceae bacterium]